MSGNNQPVVCAGFKLGNSEQARSIGYAEEQAPLCVRSAEVTSPRSWHWI